MEELRVEENKIVNSSGKEVILKGININSPCILKYEENHDFLQDIKEIKKIGANAVRIPICPAYWQFDKNYCKEILDPIIKLTKKLNLYCCLDWHAQGNPYKNKTREFRNDLINGFEKYDAKKEIAFDALEKLGKKYGKEEHIIFDVFSMPIDIENGDWIKIAQEFVDKIRKNTKNIVVINGTNWSSDLSWVLENPIKSKNIVYGLSYYPLEKFKDLSLSLKVKERYPIIFSECGYTKDGYFKGIKEDYGMKLKKYITENNISFFAWCYHPKRVPILLNSWNPDDLTEWGKLLREGLLKESCVYITIAEGKLKKEIDIIQSKMRDIIGDVPYFSQWPPHMTLSYGNNLSEEELNLVNKRLDSIASNTKSFPIIFDKEIVFITKNIGNIKFYGIKLKILPNENLNNISKKIINIADNFEAPIKGFFKSEFHLTILTTPDISDEMFEKLKAQSSSWKITSPAIINSFSIVGGGSMYKNYPIMSKEIKRFKLKK